MAIQNKKLHLLKYNYMEKLVEFVLYISFIGLTIYYLIVGIIQIFKYL
jgi:hypothetical protein